MSEPACLPQSRESDNDDDGVVGGGMYKGRKILDIEKNFQLFASNYANEIAQDKNISRAGCARPSMVT